MIMMMITEIMIFSFGKFEKYQDLAKKLKNLWNINVWIISMVIRARGTTPKDFHK